MALPTAGMVSQAVEPVALYLKPLSVISSLPATIVPCKVAPSLVISVAASVTTLGGTISFSLSKVVNKTVTHSE